MNEKYPCITKNFLLYYIDLKEEAMNNGDFYVIKQLLTSFKGLKLKYDLKNVVSSICFGKHILAIIDFFLCLFHTFLFPNL